MYSIQTTPGFIIRSRPSGEAGKLISLFTRELGLVLASAQGIRLEKSKLRPFTQDYSFGIFSFVRGKEMWRLTSAQEGSERLMGNAGGSLKKRGSGDITSSRELLAVRIASLLERLLHGEEPHPALFDRVETALTFGAMDDLNAEELETFESLTVLGILHDLGYVGTDPLLAGYVTNSGLNVDLIRGAVQSRKVINQHINKALRESHL